METETTTTTENATPPSQGVAAEPSAGASPADSLLQPSAAPTEAPTLVDENAWSWSKGMQGEGECPEWFKKSKYGSVEEQAKAYNELHSKFGSFTGSPKDGYKIKVNDNLKAAGLGDLNMEDPHTKDFLTFCQANNVNNDFANDLINIWGNMQNMAKEHEQMEIKKFQDLQQKELVESKIDTGITTQWLENTLGVELFEKLKENGVGEALYMRVFDKLRTSNSYAQPITETLPQNKMTKTDLQEITKKAFMGPQQNAQAQEEATELYNKLYT